MSSKLKAITTKAKQLYKTGKYKKWTDAIKEASKSLSHGKKVSGVKKTVKKKTVKKATKKKAIPKNYHKDSKSHNVKISVMSGTDNISNEAIKQIKQSKQAINNYTKLIDKYKNIVNNKETHRTTKNLYKKQIENLKHWILIEKELINKRKKFI